MIGESYLLPACFHLTLYVFHVHDLILSDQIKAIRSTSQIGHEFTVIWVPRRTLVGDQMLEESGVLGDVSVHQCPLYFVPLETDLLSLELQDSFTDIYLVCSTS